LAGCSSVKTRVDTGPIKASTFSFINTGSKPVPAGADNTAALHAVVQDDMTRTLASKGLSKLPTGGDVTVGYLIIAGNNVSTTALGEYFGYNSDADALAEKVHTAQTIKSERRDYFEAGTLVIDLIDPRTNKLLWRNSVQRDILRNPTPEVRAARLQEAVDSCLSGLRIER
jgi:hypothetical protein